MSSNNTASQVWAALNVSSVGAEFGQEQGATIKGTMTPNGCTYGGGPCGTGVSGCSTICASNCCFTPEI